MSSGRNPPIRQGVITINCDISQKDKDNRKKNADAYSNMAKGENGGLRIYPGGGDTRMLQFFNGELALTYTGARGVNSMSKKPNVFTSLNGIIIPGDATIEDVADGISLVGICKIDHDPSNPATPQNGVSVGLAGLFRIAFNTTSKKISYPGEYWMVVLPDPDSGPRTYPLFRDIPSAKILPRVEPLDVGSLHHYTYKITSLAYHGSDLGKVPLHFNPDHAKPPLTPTLKAIHKTRLGEITTAFKVIEVLVKRGELVIPDASTAPKAKETYSKILRRTPKDEMEKRKKALYELAVKIGLIQSSSVNDAISPVENELQKDMFNASMWPYLSSSDKVDYQPDISYKTSPSRPGTGITGMKDNTATAVRRNAQAYLQMATDAKWNQDCAMTQQKVRINSKIIGKSLEPVDPMAQNPFGDVLQGCPINFF